VNDDKVEKRIKDLEEKVKRLEAEKATWKEERENMNKEIKKLSERNH
jgi:chromosome segregation ATPase